MSIDRSKLSNKGDLMALIGIVCIFSLFALVIYLAYSENSFLSGFLASTIVWKWKEWAYTPIDNFFEKNWT